MKKIIITFIVIAISLKTYGQQIISGDYGDGLKIAFDNKTKKITGYFESYTGWDEQTNNPRFSCIFYIEGTVLGKIFKIKTYFPTDKITDLIIGTMEIVDEKTIKIKLPNEHGGCWNVQHFVDEPVQFTLDKSIPWIQISYINKDKTYFYQDRSENMKLKAYLIKGDFVCVEKIENGWALCTYYGKKETKGWLHLQDLNSK